MTPKEQAICILEQEGLKNGLILINNQINTIDKTNVFYREKMSYWQDVKQEIQAL